MDKPIKHDKLVFKIPKNEETDKMFKTLSKYLNKDTYKMWRRFSGNSLGAHTRKEDATHYRIYLEENETQGFLDERNKLREENIKLAELHLKHYKKGKQLEEEIEKLRETLGHGWSKSKKDRDHQHKVIENLKKENRKLKEQIVGQHNKSHLDSLDTTKGESKIGLMEALDMIETLKKQKKNLQKNVNGQLKSMKIMDIQLGLLFHRLKDSTKYGEFTFFVHQIGQLGRDNLEVFESKIEGLIAKMEDEGDLDLGMMDGSKDK
tara:strand:+ start:1161 stop:1949 length:789 start_codon:yes stop_codon:yes gene_type:complete